MKICIRILWNTFDSPGLILLQVEKNKEFFLISRKNIVRDHKERQERVSE